MKPSLTLEETERLRLDYETSADKLEDIADMLTESKWVKR